MEVRIQMSMKSMTNRCYTELCKLQTFEERYEYLKLSGKVGVVTFGYDRYLNQTLYLSPEWKRSRRLVLIRDQGLDLGIREIVRRDNLDLLPDIMYIVHHMNPITPKDIVEGRREVFDPEFLITTVLDTHNAIHFGDRNLLTQPLIERRPNDTCPWR